jgi:signal transduction protein with GAF and PtsI domain
MKTETKIETIADVSDVADRLLRYLEQHGLNPEQGALALIIALASMAAGRNETYAIENLRTIMAKMAKYRLEDEENDRPLWH